MASPRVSRMDLLHNPAMGPFRYSHFDVSNASLAEWGAAGYIQEDVKEFLQARCGWVADTAWPGKARPHSKAPASGLGACRSICPSPPHTHTTFHPFTTNGPDLLSITMLGIPCCKHTLR
eukprot:363043-Chlamydomonas_euryale.AAC.2